jgi:hypothetical protein
LGGYGQALWRRKLHTEILLEKVKVKVIYMTQKKME